MRAFMLPPLAAAALGCAVSASPTAAASLLCYPRDELYAGLEANHGETPAFAGVTADGKLFEVLVGPDGSFTVFLSLPQGLACPLAAGDGWRAVEWRRKPPAT